MLRRLGWILVSYLTRPRMLLSIGVGGILFIGSIIASVTQPTIVKLLPGGPSWRRIVNSIASLEEVRAASLQSQVDALDLGELWKEYNAQAEGDPVSGEELNDRTLNVLLETLKEFPNLRGVMVKFLSDQRVLDEIAKIETVEYLSLQLFPQPDLSRLKSMPNLNRIDFDYFIQPLKGLDQLQDLPHLRMLIFHSPQTVDDGVLADAGSLPHLQTLVLDFSSRPPGAITLSTAGRVTSSGFNALARATALRTVYVDHSSAAGDPLYLMAKRSALGTPDATETERRVELRHASFVRSWPPEPNFLLLTSCMLMASAIGAQLSMEFRGAASRLTPGYLSSHLIVAGGLTALLVVLTSAPLILRGAAPGAVLAMMAAMSTVTISVATPYSSVGRMGLRGPSHFVLVASVVLVGLLILSLTPTVSQPLMAGASFGLSLGLVAVSVLSVLFAIWTLRHLVDWTRSTEADASRTVSGSKRTWVMTSTWRDGWTRSLSRRENTIERAADRRGSLSKWQRIQLWRLGNPPVPMISSITFVFAAMLIFVAVLGFTVDEGLSIAIGNARFFAMYLPVALVVQIAMVWRMRRLSFPMELNRPVARRAFQWELAVAFALDMAPIAAVLAALIAISLNLDASWRPASWHFNWVRASIDTLLLFVSTLPLILGLAALFVLLERAWVAWTLTYGLGFGVTFWVAIPAFNHSYLDGGHAILIQQLWIPAVVGVGLVCIVLQRWRRLELGRID